MTMHTYCPSCDSLAMVRKKERPSNMGARYFDEQRWLIRQSVEHASGGLFA